MFYLNVSSYNHTNLPIRTIGNHGIRPSPILMTDKDDLVRT